MSYCRWSSECWKSDVYVYEDTSGGFTIHVAGRRYVSDTPRPVLSENATIEEEIKYFIEDCSAWVKTATLEPIGLSEDGKSFNVETPKEAADKLIELQELGYCVPEYAIDALIEESETV